MAGLGRRQLPFGGTNGSQRLQSEVVCVGSSGCNAWTGSARMRQASPCVEHAISTRLSGPKLWRGGQRPVGHSPWACRGLAMCWSHAQFVPLTVLVLPSPDLGFQPRSLESAVCFVSLLSRLSSPHAQEPWWPSGSAGSTRLCGSHSCGRGGGGVSHTAASGLLSTVCMS